MAMIVGMQYRPVLDLDFGRMKSLTAVVGPTPSFTRASTGTYFNSSGVLTTAAINGPRFDHVYDGTNWVSKGLLVEEQRTNSCFYSEQFNLWSPLRCNVTANSIAAPDGSTTADIMTTSVADAVNQAFIYANNSSSGQTTVSSSIFVKKGNCNYCTIYTYDSGFSNSAQVKINISTGTIISTGSGGTGWAVISAYIVNCGSGWYRILLNATKPSASTANILVSYSSLLAQNAVLGDTIYLWGGQIETGSSFPTSYIPTTTAAVTRSADVCQITGTDFSGFWNATEGSLVAEWDRFGTSGERTLYSVFGSSESTDLIYQFASGSNESCEVWVGNSPQCQLNIGAVPASGVSGKSAFAFKQNDFAASLNGAAVITDAAGNLTTCTQMKIGYGYATANCNGHIARLRYYNKRLTNATLRLFSGGTGAFQPDNISGLQFWVDANDSATLYTDSALTTLAVADGDVIGGWKDKSGNSRNALQTDGTKKPLLKLAIQNGRNIVRWDNTNDILSSTANITLGLHTIFAVSRFGLTTGSRPIIVLANAGLTNYTAVIVENNLAYISDSAGLSSVADTSTAWNQRTDSRTALTGARFSGRLNGSVRTISAASGTYTPTPNLINLGNYNALTNAPMNGDIAEVLVYDSALSNSDILLVEAYLKSKWATP